MAKPKRNWIQEERRRTLGDWVHRGGTHGSPASPLLLPACIADSRLASRPAEPASVRERGCTGRVFEG